MADLRVAYVVTPQINVAYIIRECSCSRELWTTLLVRHDLCAARDVAREPFALLCCCASLTFIAPKAMWEGSILIAPHDQP